MSGPAWWHSHERLDFIFRLSRNSAIAAFTLATACWIAALAIVAVLGVIVGTTAVVIALFAWFRRDDLGRGQSAQR